MFYTRYEDDTLVIISYDQYDEIWIILDIHFHNKKIKYTIEIHINLFNLTVQWSNIRTSKQTFLEIKRVGNKKNNLRMSSKYNKRNIWHNGKKSLIFKGKAYKTKTY